MAAGLSACLQNSACTWEAAQAQAVLHHTGRAGCLQLHGCRPSPCLATRAQDLQVDHQACAAQVVNVTPRYARLKAAGSKNEVIGWENIELISDRPLEVMLDDFKRLKEEFPDRCGPGSRHGGLVQAGACVVQQPGWLLV